MATTPTVGTYTISDLQAVNSISILEFGEQTVAEVVQRDLARFNMQVVEAISWLAQPISQKADRLARYGTSIDGDMVELDEMGRAPAKRAKPGVNVGFPLKKYGFAVGWTRDYMAQQTPADIAVRTTKVQKAYLRRLRSEIQRALYLASNYNFTDKFVDEVVLPVKRLLNADGDQIPNGPNGETFTGSTHTHYLANATWTQATVITAINHLTEHGHTDGVVMVINKADETSIEGFADFKPYTDPRLTIAQDTQTPVQRLSLVNTGDRPIGLLKDAVVWVKPWALSGFAFIFAQNDEKPLKWRMHNVESMRGLRLATQYDDYPLRVDQFEAYGGFGVWERSNGVMHDGSNGSYTEPTIAA